MNENELAPTGQTDRGLLSMVGAGMIETAARYATQLKDIIEKQELYTMVNDKKHVHVEGWTTMGAMLGIFPEVAELIRMDKDNPKMIQGYLVEMEKYDKYKKTNTTYQKFVKKAFYNKKTMKIIKDEEGNEIREVEEIKYLAVIDLVTMGGKKVGRAMSMCSNLEEGKLLKDEYSIASMAQTRATGKTFRLPFSWIMTLAGYAPTPFEDQETTAASFGGEEKAAAEVINPAANAPVAENTAQAPVKGAKLADRAVPEDKESQKKMWGDLVMEAKRIGISMTVFLENMKAPTPPPISWVPKLIPALGKAIDEYREKLGKPQEEALEA